MDRVQLPGLFVWPAGLADVLVGILATVIAIAYARGPGENEDSVSRGISSALST
jgi:hypothetical protein